MEEEKVEDAANDDVVKYSFTACETDLDYEYDAARFFDFCLAESSLEARQAEVWFDSARSYPPSREVDRRIEFGQFKRFSWRELQLSTNSFSEKSVLGQGGFGKVYNGVLADNTKVAVKLLTDFESPGGDTAFQREVEMISVAIHRNILRLVGFCTTPNEHLLVYPFMQNLSVSSRLRVKISGKKGWGTKSAKSQVFYEASFCSCNCGDRA